jgi:hypothetical protein
MGMIGTLFGMLFGDGRNVVRETVETFRPNAEAADQRGADMQQAALSQFASEFQPRRGLFDRLIDALNRLPRPMLALGCIGLVVSAMVDPIWFSERMAGVALIPEPLWWLLGIIVSFYFGARHQAKGQEFQKSIAATVAMAPKVVENIKSIRALRHDSPGVAATEGDAEATIATVRPGNNAALIDWRERV